MKLSLRESSKGKLLALICTVFLEKFREVEYKVKSRSTLLAMLALSLVLLGLVFYPALQTARAQDPSVTVEGQVHKLYLPLIKRAPAVIVVPTPTRTPIPTDPEPMTLAKCQAKFGSGAQISKAYPDGTVWQNVIANYLGVAPGQISTLSDDLIEIFELIEKTRW